MMNADRSLKLRSFCGGNPQTSKARWSIVIRSVLAIQDHRVVPAAPEERCRRRTVRISSDPIVFCVSFVRPSRGPVAKSQFFAPAQSGSGTAACRPPPTCGRKPASITATEQRLRRQHCHATRKPGWSLDQFHIATIMRGQHQPDYLVPKPHVSGMKTAGPPCFCQMSCSRSPHRCHRPIKRLGPLHNAESCT